MFPDAVCVRIEKAGVPVFGTRLLKDLVRIVTSFERWTFTFELRAITTTVWFARIVQYAIFCQSRDGSIGNFLRSCDIGILDLGKSTVVGSQFRRCSRKCLGQDRH
ncbi:hypothetical protein KC327_g23 [Hortaea werneckii]|nr:hypothetical protein KC327_g23 [Hortaea werneckii]